MAWFLQDLASEQDVEGTMVLEQSRIFEADGLRFRNNPDIINTAVAQVAISKGRLGRDAPAAVYLANLSLKGVATDVLITADEPMMINPLSETADTVGVGLPVPAAQSGRLPMAEL